jgi:hypothetical protein
MAGDTKCHWGSWYKTRYTGYKKAPSDFQLTKWTIEHTQLLDTLIKQRGALNEATYIEDQNYFKVKRSSGLVIAGKPDLVTINSLDQCKVYDVKTGNPRQSDVVQIMLYMMCLPYSSPRYRGKKINGCLVYKDGTCTEVPEKAIDNDFRDQVTYFLNILQTPVSPDKIPSSSECQFCEIGSPDCGERINKEPIICDEPEITF